MSLDRPTKYPGSFGVGGSISLHWPSVQCSAASHFQNCCP